MGEREFHIELIYEETGTSTPPGGQHAGIPAHSVRITHLPTGVMAQCGHERSQHKNRRVAMEMLEWALVSMGVPYAG